MRFGNNAVFRRIARDDYAVSANPATMKGIALKTILLLGVSIVTAILCIIFIQPLDELSSGIVLFGYLLSPILTLILSFIISFMPTSAKTLSIPYSILQGISIGTIVGLLTAVLGSQGALLAGLALIITLTYFLAATILYSTNVVKVTNGMRRFVFVGLFGLIMSSMFIGLLSFFMPDIREIFYGYTSIGLLVSILSVIIAAVYSFITLEHANRLVELGVDKVFEWYASFGIIVNIIWLFYEVLRLLTFFTRRN